MYQLMVKRQFVAQHFLTVPNCGPENEWHSHVFTVEVRLRAVALDAHGYLVDITEVKAALDHLVGRFKDATMNDLPEFAGLNPSIEHFARIFCEGLLERIHQPHLSEVEVRMWEDDFAWASYTRALP